MNNTFKEKDIRLATLNGKILDNAYNTDQHGGGNGGGGDMIEKRIEKLESDISSIKTDLAVIRSNYATATDLHKEISAQTKWICTILITIIGISLGAIKLLFFLEKI